MSRTEKSLVFLHLKCEADRRLVECLLSGVSNLRTSFFPTTCTAYEYVLEQCKAQQLFRMACDAEDCGFKMLNDGELVTSVQEESDPVDDEMNEDEDNNNNENSEGPSNVDVFSVLKTAMELYEQPKSAVLLNHCCSRKSETLHCGFVQKSQLYIMRLTTNWTSVSNCENEELLQHVVIRGINKINIRAIGNECHNFEPWARDDDDTVGSDGLEVLWPLHKPKVASSSPVGVNRFF
ncbi:UNVERIFIED_CONTAM: hypothetical protein NCL1_36063 [Trichonephila clavipes]